MSRHARQELRRIAFGILDAGDQRKTERAPIFASHPRKLDDRSWNGRVAEAVPDDRLHHPAIGVRQLELPKGITVFGELSNACHDARTPLAERSGLEQREFHS